MPTLKKQTIIDGYLKYEFQVNVFEPGEPLPAHLRDSPLVLSDRDQPEMLKPGERQFVTGIYNVYYNQNVGEGEPEWVNLNTLDIPLVEKELKRLRIENRNFEQKNRGLKARITRMKNEMEALA